MGKHRMMECQKCGGTGFVEADEARLLLKELIQIINPREKATDDRLRNVRARLKDYNRVEIVESATVFSQSDWHRENKQMSIDNLIRASKFGRWYQASQEPERKKFV